MDGRGDTSVGSRKSNTKIQQTQKMVNDLRAKHKTVVLDALANISKLQSSQSLPHSCKIETTAHTFSTMASNSACIC